MQIFHYDGITGEFSQTGEARPHPIRKGQFLIPANATDIAPPPPLSRSARVFRDGAWGYIEDHRGSQVWIDHEQGYVIEELGPLPDGVFVERPPAPPKSDAEIREEINFQLSHEPQGFGGPSIKDIF